jgi:hypothetical protein
MANPILMLDLKTDVSKSHSLLGNTRVYIYIYIGGVGEGGWGLGHDRMVVAQLPMQSVPMTTSVVRSNPTHGMVYSIQHYLIKFVNDLRQVSGFLQVRQFPPPINVTAIDIAEILLKSALNTINLILTHKNIDI